MHHAPVAELADAPDLGSGVSRREGSSPFRRTKNLTPNVCKSLIIKQKRDFSTITTPHFWRLLATYPGLRRFLATVHTVHDIEM